MHIIRSSFSVVVALFSRSRPSRKRIEDQVPLRKVALRNNLASTALFARSFVAIVYKNASSVSGRCNRRQVKPRNKNSRPRPYPSVRHEGFNQQYGKMFDDPIDHSSLSSFRERTARRRVHIHVLLLRQRNGTRNETETLSPSIDGRRTSISFLSFCETIHRPCAITTCVNDLLVDKTFLHSYFYYIKASLAFIM